MLLAAINYQLNLGYALTFLLAGAGVVSMHLTHGNLRGLTLHLRPTAPVFAGEPALLEVVLTTPAASAMAWPALRGPPRARPTLAWCDVPAPGPGQRAAELRAAARRGWHAVPTLVVETVFPAGPVPRLDGVAAGRPRAGLAAARTPAAAAAAAAGAPGEDRPQQPQRRPAANSTACAPGGAATPAPGGVEEGGAQRRDGQPRHRRHRRPRTVAGLGRRPRRRRRAAAVAPGRLGAGGRPRWAMDYGCSLPGIATCRPARATPSAARRWTCAGAVGHRAHPEREPCAPAWPTPGPPAARHPRHPVPAGVIGWTIAAAPAAPALWCGPGGRPLAVARPAGDGAAARCRNAGSSPASWCWPPGLTLWSERTLLGKEAGVTLLVVLMALKTLELRARRDALVVFFLGFFLVLTQLPVFAVAGHRRCGCWWRCGAC
jgi:hypothetical protein